MTRMAYFLISSVVLFSVLPAHAQDPLIERPYTKDDDTNFSYSIFNDDHSIIVALKVQDPAEAVKLARNGMEIWIDPKGKKNKKIGVHYPLGPSADDLQPRQNRMMEMNSGDTGSVFLRKQAVITLLRKKDVEYVGFKPEINGRKDISDTGNISIATAYPAKDALYYSVRIPFTAFREPIDPHHPFSVGIIIKGMQMGNGGSDGGSPGDDGGPGGGGPPPGGGPGGSDGDDFRKIFGDDAVWQKVNLKP
jgi:hypothetical protein